MSVYHARIIVALTVLLMVPLGIAVGLFISTSSSSRVEVRIESPYPEFTCQEDELMVWVDREKGLARCINLEEWEAMQ